MIVSLGHFEVMYKVLTVYDVSIFSEYSGNGNIAEELIYLLNACAMVHRC